MISFSGFNEIRVLLLAGHSKMSHGFSLLQIKPKKHSSTMVTTN